MASATGAQIEALLQPTKAEPANERSTAPLATAILLA
jgi:hypothetical protein